MIQTIPQIEPEHLLTTLVEQREGVVPEVLRKLNVNPAEVATAARALLARLPQARGGATPGLAPRLNGVADAAQGEAETFKDEFVSTEHLFIAIAGETGRAPSASTRSSRSSSRWPWLRLWGCGPGYRAISSSPPSTVIPAAGR